MFLKPRKSKQKFCVKLLARKRLISYQSRGFVYKFEEIFGIDVVKAEEIKAKVLC